MANTLKFKRGLVATIPTAALGEPLFTTDTFDLYIGNGTGNTRFQKYIASGATTQILRGDGSLYTFPLNISSPTNGQVLKYDGTNWVNSADAGVTGSGAAGQVTYWGSSSTITGSNNLFWDNTNARLGIRTTTPLRGLEVASDGTNWISGVFAGSGGTDKVVIGNLSSAATIGGHGTALTGWTNLNIVAANIVFKSNGENDRGRIHSSGNWLIGTSTDQGYKLDVVGTLRSTTTTYLATNTGNVLVGTTTDNGLRFQVTGDGYFSGAVGIGTSSLTGFSLLINQALTTGTALAASSVRSTIQSNATLEWNSYQSLVSTQAASFTLTNLRHFAAQQSSLGAGSSVTNQYGFIAASSLTGATNNYGFFGDIASGTGRWNLYMNGTANNYLAGSLAVGTTTTTNRLEVWGSGNTAARIVGQSAGNATLILSSGGVTAYSIKSGNGDSSLRIDQDGTERIMLASGGNLLIGTTTNSTFKLDVNGTMRVSGASTFTGNGTNGYVYINGNAGSGGATNPVYQRGMSLSWNRSSGGGENLLTWSNFDGGSNNRFAISFWNGTTLTENITAYPNGNVGINTSTPQAGLDVNGTIKNHTITNPFLNGYTASFGNTRVVSTTNPQFELFHSGNSVGQFSFASNTLNYGVHNGSGTQTTYLTIASGGAATFSSSVTAANLYSTGASNFATSSGNVGIGTASPGYKLHVQTSGASGTSFGLRVQAGTNSSDAAMQILSQAGSTYLFLRGDNNLGFGTSLVGATGTNTLSVFNGTAPSSNLTDTFQMYSNDVTAGNAAPHFRSENGAIIKLYQETTAVGNSTISVGGGNAVLDDTEFDGYTLRQVVRALRNQGILQ